MMVRIGKQYHTPFKGHLLSSQKPLLPTATLMFPHMCTYYKKLRKALNNRGRKDQRRHFKASLRKPSHLRTQCRKSKTGKRARRLTHTSRAQQTITKEASAKEQEARGRHGARHGKRASGPRRSANLCSPLRQLNRKPVYRSRRLFRFCHRRLVNALLKLLTTKQNTFPHSARERSRSAHSQNCEPNALFTPKARVCLEIHPKPGSVCCAWLSASMATVAEEPPECFSHEVRRENEQVQRRAQGRKGKNSRQVGIHTSLDTSTPVITWSQFLFSKPRAVLKTVQPR